MSGKLATISFSFSKAIIIWEKVSAFLDDLLSFAELHEQYTEVKCTNIDNVY